MYFRYLLIPRFILAIYYSINNLSKEKNKIKEKMHLIPSLFINPKVLKRVCDSGHFW